VLRLRVCSISEASGARPLQVETKAKENASLIAMCDELLGELEQIKAKDAPAVLELERKHASAVLELERKHAKLAGIHKKTVADLTALRQRKREQDENARQAEKQASEARDHCGRSRSLRGLSFAVGDLTSSYAQLQALEREIQEAVVSYQKTYACPISLDLMVDPVIAAGQAPPLRIAQRFVSCSIVLNTGGDCLTDGHTYERKNILQHFAVRRARGAPVGYRLCVLYSLEHARARGW